MTSCLIIDERLLPPLMFVPCTAPYLKTYQSWIQTYRCRLIRCLSKYSSDGIYWDTWPGTDGTTDACYLHCTVLEDMSILNLEGVPVQVRGSIRCSKYSGDGIYWGRMIKDCWDRCVLAALPRLGATCVSSVGSVLKFINKLVSKPLWSQIKNASNPQPSSSTASAVEWSGLLVCFSSVIVEFNFALLATHLFRHFVSAILVGLLSLLC